VYKASFCLVNRNLEHVPSWGGHGRVAASPVAENVRRQRSLVEPLTSQHHLAHNVVAHQVHMTAGGPGQLGQLGQALKRGQLAHLALQTGLAELWMFRRLQGHDVVRVETGGQFDGHKVGQFELIGVHQRWRYDGCHKATVAKKMYT